MASAGAFVGTTVAPLVGRGLGAAADAVGADVGAGAASTGVIDGRVGGCVGSGSEGSVGVGVRAAADAPDTAGS
jgi:hypothetical protein